MSDNRHIKNRKGMEALGTIGTMLIILIILAIILNALGVLPSIFTGLQTCEGDRGGRCTSAADGCSSKEYNIGVSKGCDIGQICCKSTEPAAETETMTKEQRAAFENPILLTINKDSTSIPTSKVIPLMVGFEYNFTIRLNDKLPQAYKDGYCAVYITDSRQVGSKYLLNKASSDSNSLEPGDANGVHPSLEVLSCKSLEKRSFSPSYLDVFKDLNMYIILFDSNLTDAAAQVVKSAPDITNEPMKMAYASQVFMDMYSNPSHWRAYRVNKLDIAPLVRITGLNTEWSAKDDITITCTDVNCENIGLALVQLNVNSEGAGDYSALYDSCKQANFAYQIDTITSVTSKTTGIPLLPALNIGGFRIPTQKQEVLYLTQRKMITVVKNKATVTLDKATMIKDFYAYNQNPEMFLGDRTYLCAKATLSDKDKTTIFAVSEQPLKIDILPPRVDQDNGIQVIYPQAEYGAVPSRTTPYYYRQYPRVVVQCDDYGQSGCARYDYYVKTGNFIDLNLHTDDLGTAIGATLLTQGLNMLLGHFAQKDALNTICPFILSNEYRPNSFPEIRFSGNGQGIICIRVEDKAGNQVIVWKSLWTPEQMFEGIIANTTSTALSSI